FIIVNYGISIPEVARNIQNNVKQAIEGMTGLDVVEVNIHVLGVHFPQPVQEEQPGDAPPARVK
ncbi:MAG: Asp23/Gls24 family envelope stress response protein, partial [Limnochordia bacterium]